MAIQQSTTAPTAVPTAPPTPSEDPHRVGVLELNPGTRSMVMGIKAADSAARQSLGQDNYEAARSGVTNAYALTGFTLFNPLLWGIQIPMFVIFTVLFIWVGAGWWSPVLGWISQGIVMFIILKFYVKFLLNIGIGI